jgi:predicted nucleotidyltransferase
MIELREDGKLLMECWLNGARTLQILDRGTELWQIMDQLAEKRAEIQATAKRKADAKAKAEAIRHQKVKNNILADHPGIFNRIYAQEEAQKTSGKVIKIVATEDLL